LHRQGRDDARLTEVLIVSDFAEVNGGQAKVAIHTARLLADAGVKVSFFAATGPVSPLLEHPGIEVICLGQHTLLENPSRMQAMLSGLWNQAAAQALAAEAARHDPEHTVILCHGWAKALSPAIGPVLARCGLPCLYTMHEYFLACPNGGFYDYQKGEICTRVPFGASCLTCNCDARHVAHKVWRLVRSAIARSIGRLPGGLHDFAYISHTQHAAMAPYLPRNARLHHLPNPVAPEGARIAARDNRNFVFVGRLAPEKGAALFAQAAKQLGVHAVFVGDGPEAETIRRLNPEAEITGWVTPAQVQEHLSRARAVVFPSLWYECQPLVPIEALLRGVPVVCGRWSAAHEVVEDGVNGVIYDAPTAEALAEALSRVQAIGDFDSTALAEAVSPEHHLESLLAICNQMLAA